MRVLNVAEKPSVAKKISQILSNRIMQTRNGLSKYNKIFEFKYALGSNTLLMKFTSVTGHIKSFEFLPRFKKWRDCAPGELFAAPIQKCILEGRQPLVNTLIRESKNAKMLILWLDCDREGENIAFDVLEECLKSNPNLIIKRAKFSALIPRDIHNAIKNLAEPDKRLSDAVRARQELDLRAGAAFTRFLTFRINERFSQLKNQIISYGPCQFPTLGFVVDQYLKVKNFVPEKFWRIDLSIEESGKKIDFTWERGHLFERAAVFVIYEMCMSARQVKISSVQRKKTLRMKPLPLTTVEMQKCAASYLRFSAKKTMEIAEKLYQKGYVSYPRTETNIFKSGTDFPALIRPHVESSQYGDFANRLMGNLFSQPRRGNSDDKAHPPIHPLKHVTDFENNDEKKLFEFIVRHFLAAVSKNATGEQMEIRASLEGECFIAKGTKVIEENFYEVYTYQKWKTFILPNCDEGSVFVPSKLEIAESRTSAPKLLNESQLISLMDQNGIGTDATIAIHVSKIQDRGYAKKENNLFIPTPLGVALIEGFRSCGDESVSSLSKPVVRAEVERCVSQIATGNLQKEEFTTKYVKEMKKTFDLTVQKGPILENKIAFHLSQASSSLNN